jgi:cytochrome c556
MKRTQLTILLGATLLGLIATFGHSQQPGSQPVKMFMRLKLEPAQRILEGIATEDYDLINQSAQRIRTLTLDENWMTSQSPEYKAHSKEFQQTINRISEAAKNRNIDSATLNYVQMTLQCTSCHRSLRK